jgi:RNA polymerase sigma factor (TIGR02999 family)
MAAATDSDLFRKAPMNESFLAAPSPRPDRRPASHAPARPPERQAHDQRFAAMYAELRRLAHREALRHGPHAPLRTTTLVHELYLDMAHRDGLEFADRGRFLAYAARAMRGLVIDRVRARAAVKRGGDVRITVLDTMAAEEVQSPDDLQEISDALDELATLAPELARVVDLRFFCGFTMQEIASQLGLSERSVQRQWDKARTMLLVALKRA